VDTDDARQRAPLGYLVKFWLVNLGLPIAFVGVACWEYLRFARNPWACSGVAPLLSGPAQITLLALIIALAAYLRGVHTSAIGLRNQIRCGDVWAYPIDAEFTTKKLRHLDHIAESIRIASPFFIILSVALALRIMIDSRLRYLRYDPQCNQILLAADVGITLWLLVGIMALMITHFMARRKDSAIAKEARSREIKSLEVWLAKKADGK